MVELSKSAPQVFNQSFAGDVYNSAVYLKRCFPNVQSEIVTAIGKDSLSDQMLETFVQEGLGTNLVFRHDQKVPGLYLIETDETGERSFIYWRNDAAARKVVSFFDDDVIDTFSRGDIFFLSGISLAILEDPDRERLWQVLNILNTKGVHIVFDPNYRARLWANPEQAIVEFNKAFEVAHSVLPGIEDFEVLYGLSSTKQILSFLKGFNVIEVVIKNGPESVTTWADGKEQSHKVTPVANVVDTTSAGDAFNGAYIGARLSGWDIEDAVANAAKAAGTVIQFAGAIVPAPEFSAAMA